MKETIKRMSLYIGGLLLCALGMSTIIYFVSYLGEKNYEKRQSIEYYEGRIDDIQEIIEKKKAETK